MNRKEHGARKEYKEEQKDVRNETSTPSNKEEEMSDEDNFSDNSISGFYIEKTPVKRQKVEETPIKINKRKHEIVEKDSINSKLDTISDRLGKLEFDSQWIETVVDKNFKSVTEDMKKIANNIDVCELMLTKIDEKTIQLNKYQMEHEDKTLLEYQEIIKILRQVNKNERSLNDNEQKILNRIQKTEDKVKSLQKKMYETCSFYNNSIENIQNAQEEFFNLMLNRYQTQQKINEKLINHITMLEKRMTIFNFKLKKKNSKRRFKKYKN